jgi:biotin carboxyl carrier protein
MTARQTIALNDTLYETTLTRKYALRKPYVPKDPGAVGAVIPGLILGLLVAPRERVRRGQGLLVLEAMKMQNRVTAPLDGVVETVAVAPGDTVAKGQLLLVLRPDPDTL